MDSFDNFAHATFEEPSFSFSNYVSLRNQPASSVISAPKFIDLFAGIGGFHKGFSENGFECVFACEIEPHLQELYLTNYGLLPHGDIRTIDERKIPKHDVMCAGFPCQPFSLAGKKKGAECPASGRLIDDVIRIAKYHQPKFIVLENVPNVLTIANGHFWNYLKSSFEDIGYILKFKIISPVDIGIPQNRKRLFIVAAKSVDDLDKFEWPESIDLPKDALLNILDKTLPHKKLEPRKCSLLKHWQNLLDNLHLDSMPSLSIAAPEFGATYPLNFKELTLEQIKMYRGAYGNDLSTCNTWDDVLVLMPSYVRKNKAVPQWIIQSIEFSRRLYSENVSFLDCWKALLPKEFNSWQILEWRGLKRTLDIYSHLVQFRASGIRILKREIAPSLISMTPTQIPVVPSEDRYMSEFEAAKLQNLHDINAFPDGTTKSFRAFGNAVNAKVVGLISKKINSILR